MTTADKEHLQKLIETKYRRSYVLKEQQARMGIDTPPHVITEMEDIEAELEKLKVELSTLGGVEAPANLSDRDRQYQIALHWAEDGRNSYLSRFDLSQRDLQAEQLSKPV
jgi:hypothetical protein